MQFKLLVGLSNGWYWFENGLVCDSVYLIVSSIEYGNRMWVCGVSKNRWLYIWQSSTPQQTASAVQYRDTKWRVCNHSNKFAMIHILHTNYTIWFTYTSICIIATVIHKCTLLACIHYSHTYTNIYINTIYYLASL